MIKFYLHLVTLKTKCSKIILYNTYILTQFMIFSEINEINYDTFQRLFQFSIVIFFHLGHISCKA